MRRVLPLALLVVVAVGCGDRTYSDADVRRAFAGFHLEQVPVLLPPAYYPTFATWAAVTDLRIDEGSAVPAAYYGAEGLTIARYRTPHEAAVGSRGPVAIVTFAGANADFEVEQRGNLILVVSGRRRAVEAAAARLP
jgi:hypothetical protein